MKQRHLIMLGMLTLAGSAMAEPEQTLRLRGEITAVQGQELTVHSRDGKDLHVTLTPQTRVAQLSVASLDAIKPGSYIGTAAANLPDGTLKAYEVHIFPPAMKGTGDGHRPWDGAANSSMTNGSVGTIVGTNRRTITVKYQNGEKTVIVPPDVPVVNIEPGSPALLVKGAKIFAQVVKNGDSGFSAKSISVGKNGLTPPM